MSTPSILWFLFTTANTISKSVSHLWIRSKVCIRKHLAQINGLHMTNLHHIVIKHPSLYFALDGLMVGLTSAPTVKMAHFVPCLSATVSLFSASFFRLIYVLPRLVLFWFYLLWVGCRYILSLLSLAGTFHKNCFHTGHEPNHGSLRSTRVGLFGSCHLGSYQTVVGVKAAWVLTECGSVQQGSRVQLKFSGEDGPGVLLLPPAAHTDCHGTTKKKVVFFSLILWTLIEHGGISVRSDCP